MNLQHPRDPWARLTASARQVTDERDTAAPYGFSTRIAALALATGRPVASVFDRFALRALGIATLLAMGSVALNYNALPSLASSNPVIASVDEIELPAPQDDAVAIVLDFAD